MSENGRLSLNERQEKALRFIAAYIEENGIAPTTNEVGEAIGAQFASAYYALTSLERKGYLRRIPDTARGIEVIRLPPSG